MCSRRTLKGSTHEPALARPAGRPGRYAAAQVRWPGARPTAVNPGAPAAYRAARGSVTTPEAERHAARAALPEARPSAAQDAAASAANGLGLVCGRPAILTHGNIGALV
jgi:hypothetical protein